MGKKIIFRKRYELLHQPSIPCSFLSLRDLPIIDYFILTISIVFLIFFISCDEFDSVYLSLTGKDSSNWLRGYQKVKSTETSLQYLLSENLSFSNLGLFMFDSVERMLTERYELEQLSFSFTQHLPMGDQLLFLK